MTICRGVLYRLKVCDLTFVPVAPFSVLVDNVLANTTVAAVLGDTCDDCYSFDFTIPCANIDSGCATITITDATPNTIHQEDINLQ